MVVAARRIELVNQVAQSVGGLGVDCDITDDQQVQALAAAAIAAYGKESGSW